MKYGKTEVEKRHFVIFFIAVHNEAIVIGNKPTLMPRTKWIECRAFDRLAETLNQYNKTGSIVALNGQMDTDDIDNRVYVLIRDAIYMDKFYNREITERNKAELKLQEVLRENKKYKEMLGIEEKEEIGEKENGST